MWKISILYSGLKLAIMKLVEIDHAWNLFIMYPFELCERLLCPISSLCVECMLLQSMLLIVWVSCIPLRPHYLCFLAMLLFWKAKSRPISADTAAGSHLAPLLLSPCLVATRPPGLISHKSLGTTGTHGHTRRYKLNLQVWLR